MSFNGDSEMASWEESQRQLIAQDPHLQNFQHIKYINGEHLSRIKANANGGQWGFWSVLTCCFRLKQV
jgi:hypothetical protein